MLASHHPNQGDRPRRAAVLIGAAFLASGCLIDRGAIEGGADAG